VGWARGCNSLARTTILLDFPTFCERRVISVRKVAGTDASFVARKLK
jgi:hypothetical protein